MALNFSHTLRKALVPASKVTDTKPRPHMSLLRQTSRSQQVWDRALLCVFQSILCHIRALRHQKSPEKEHYDTEKRLPEDAYLSAAAPKEP